MKKYFKFALLFLILLFQFFMAFPQESVNRFKEFNLEKGIALQGYDPVSYFTKGKAEKGNSSVTFQHKGVTYQFISNANREIFKLNPEKYEPAYGGWCAYAMGNDGSKVEVDPETFKVADNNLYLFYNFYFNNTLKKWNASEITLKKNADANWKKIMVK